MRRLFLAEIANFPTKSRWFPKKKSFSPKFEGFFWPKSQISTFFPPKNTNLKIYRGGKKKIGGAKTKIGGALPSRWRRACMQTNYSKAQNRIYMIYFAWLKKLARVCFLSMSCKFKLRTWIKWLQLPNFTTFKFYLQYCFSFCKI